MRFDYKITETFNLLTFHSIKINLIWTKSMNYLDPEIIPSNDNSLQINHLTYYAKI